MPTPATELQKLLELRDAGELTEAEFAAAKARVLHTDRPLPPRSSGAGSTGLFSSFGRGMMTLLVTIGVLIGGTTLIAMTEAGAIALLALGLLAVALIAIWIFKESLWF